MTTNELREAAPRALRMALRDMEAIGRGVPESASLVGYFCNRLNEIALTATTNEAAAQADGRGVTKIDPGFRWDHEAKHHVPTLTVEFSPCPMNSGSDAQGWKDRDALAAALATQPVQAQGEAAGLDIDPKSTVGDLAKHVGAWETSEGFVCFGSWMAVAAMHHHILKGAAEQWRQMHPAPAVDRGLSEAVATVNQTGWELLDSEVCVFGVPVHNFAGARDAAEKLADAINRAAAHAPAVDRGLSEAPSLRAILQQIVDADDAHALCQQHIELARRALAASAPSQAEPIGNLGPLDPNEGDASRLWAEIVILREMLKGPPGFTSWQDAAVHERMAKNEALRKLKALAPSQAGSCQASEPVSSLDAAEALLAAGHEFWLSVGRENYKAQGAVQWLTASDGALVLFTRGEYKQTLLNNIATLPGAAVVYWEHHRDVDGDERGLLACAKDAPPAGRTLTEDDDAKRYRWLRSNFSSIDFVKDGNSLRVQNGPGFELLDVVIDTLAASSTTAGERG